jgi:hypothetical protein
MRWYDRLKTFRRRELAQSSRPAYRLRGRLFDLEPLEDRTLLSSTIQAFTLPSAGQTGSQPPSGTAAGTSFSPSISGDGRYVAFQSDAANLVPGQTNAFPGETNVFLLDRGTGSVTLVSHKAGSTTNALPNSSSKPILSAGGRYLVYNTRADNGEQVVMMFDAQTGQNSLASSHASDGVTVPDSSSDVEGISPNGRYVVFASAATDLVPGTSTDNSFRFELFVYDKGDADAPGASPTTYLVTYSASRGQFVGANDGSDSATVNDDGTVIYRSFATDICIVPPFITGNVYIAEFGTGNNPKGYFNDYVSFKAFSGSHGAGEEGSDPVLAEVAGIPGSIRIAFVSFGPNLVVNQVGSGSPNVYLYNNQTNGVFSDPTHTLVSGALGSPTVTTAGTTYGVPAISGDGRFIAFASDATNLILGQGGSGNNIFLYDAQTSSLTLVSGVLGSQTVGAGGVPALDFADRANGQPDPITGGAVKILSINEDGSLIAYVSQANDIVNGQSGPAGVDNLFLYNRITGVTTLVTTTAGSSTGSADGESSGPVLSGDGSVLAFHTLATDLVAGLFDGNGLADVAIYTPASSPSLNLVTVPAFPVVPAPGNSFTAIPSGSGRYTVYTSSSNNLVPNQLTLNTNLNIFLYDRASDTTALVNHVPGAPATTGDGGVPGSGGSTDSRPASYFEPVVSADGTYVAFVSYDDNLVTGESGGSGGPSVYLYNVQTQVVTLVSHAPGADDVIASPNLAFNPVINSDGSYVAYEFGNSTSGTSFNSGGLALYSLAADSTTVIVPLNGSGQGGASGPVISDDGKRTVYELAASSQRNVYVFDRTSGVSTLVSHEVDAPGTPANGDSSAAVLSGSGSSVAFVSTATNLVFGLFGGAFTNVYFYAVATGSITLVSLNLESPTFTGGNGNSDSPALSTDGRFVAFRSDASDLIPGQFGITGNVFSYDSQSGVQTLISHVNGSPLQGAGGSTDPVIGGDGKLIAFRSSAGNLVSGQTAPPGTPAGVRNDFVFLGDTGVILLISGQFGSLTITANADCGPPILSSDPIPGFDSTATNLVSGLGGLSIGYLNPFFQIYITGDTLPDLSGPGTFVGTVGIISDIAGQFLPTSFALAPGGDNFYFSLSAAPGDQANLFFRSEADYFFKQFYSLTVRVYGIDPGFDAAALTVAVNAPLPPTISAIPAQVTPPGISTGPLTFVVGGQRPGAVDIGVSATVTSTTPGLLTDADVTFGGGGTTRTVTIKPEEGVAGQAVLKLLVKDNGTGLTTQTSFHLIADEAPVLGAIADPPPVPAGSASLLVPLNASSYKQRTLNFTGVATSSPLFDLQKQYAFQPANSTYALGQFGAGAKWLVSPVKNAAGNGFYILIPGGNLYAWGGSFDPSGGATSGPLLTNVGGNAYADPTILFNARPSVDYATLNALQQSYLFQGLGYFTAGGVRAFVLRSPNTDSGSQGYYLLKADGSLVGWDGSASYAGGLPVATLDPTVYSYPDLLTGALAPPALYANLNAVQQQYDLEQLGGSFYTGTYGHQAEWFYSPIVNQFGQHWYTLTPDGTLRAWQGYQDSAVGATVATLDPAVYANPAWLSGATARPDVPAVFAVSGTTLSVTPPSGFVGSFRVRVTADDQLLSVAQSFTVTVTDSAPILSITSGGKPVTPDSTLTFAHGSFPQTLAVATSGGSTVSASTSADSYAPPFVLQQRYRFQGLGYFTAGATAYVLHAAADNAFGNPYYLLKSDGTLYAYDGSGSYAQSFTSAQPVGTLSANFYADPTLLTNAQPAIDYAALYGLQQQYQFTGLGTITAGATAYVLHTSQPGPGAGGYYLLSPAGGLYPYDGSGSYAHAFASGSPLATVDPAVFVNPSLLLTAKASPAIYDQLLQVEQQYDLQELGGSFYTGLFGNAAKWLYGVIPNVNGQHWYTLILSPDGSRTLLYAWDGGNKSVPVGSQPLAILDASVYADPSLLLNAKAPMLATGVGASVSGGVLTLTAPGSFVGTFQVTVTATDGTLTTTQAFQVTSTDTAPVPVQIPTQTASASGSPLHVPLSATDAENDPVTYKAQPVGYSPAYNLQQVYHFTGLGYVSVGGVTAYVLQSNVSGGVGGFYLLKSDGGVYTYDGSGSYSHTFANSANLIGTLDPGVFATPGVLTNAQPPATPAASTNVSGNTLTVNVAGVPVGTVFEVFVTASDGAESQKTGFLVKVTQ